MAEEIIFKVGVETGNTVNDLNNIEKELNDISKQTKEINSVENAFDDLNKRVASGTLTARELGRAVKEYQTIALQAGRESPIGQAAIQEAASLQDQLADLRAEITNASHDGARMQAALQLGGTIAAGFQAAQGGMALMGVAGEDLQKTLVKLQAVQALLAGIEQIRANLEKESFLKQHARIVQTQVMTAVQTVYTTAVGASTGAMKALNVAMLAIPIVAIIAGIIALISVIASLVSEEEKAEKQNEALTKSYERQQEIFDRMSEKRKREIQNQIDLRKAQGASEEEIHNLEIKLLKENEATRMVSMRREISMVKSRKQAYLQALKEGNEDLAREIKTEIQQHKNKYKDLKNLDGQYEVDRKIAQATFNQKEREEQQKNAEKNREAWKKAREKKEQDKANAEQKQLELDRLMQDLINANIKDANKRELAILATKHKREREEIVKKYGKNAKLIKQLELKQASEVSNAVDEQTKASDEKEKEERIKLLDAKNRDEKAKLEARLIRIQDDFMLEQELKAELALMERDQLLQNDQLTAGERKKIQAEYEAKIQALNTETAERQKKLQQETIANQIAWAEKGAQALQSISDAVFSIRLRNVEKGSKEEEKIAKKQFQFNKALQLSGAIIDGAKAVTASLASAPIAIGPLPNPAGIASLAFAVTTSLANIAKIASTQFESKSAGGGGVTPPSIANPQTVTTQQGNAFNGGTNTLTGGLDENPVKVFVLDSEITAQQNNTAKVVAVSTIQ